MASTEDLGGRLESIERHLAELDQIVKHAPAEPAFDPLSRISPAAWLKVQGPVFAAMARGFGLLWNGQQTLASNMLAMQDSLHAAMRETQTSLHGAMRETQQSTQAQINELVRTTARLGATTTRLEAAIDRLEAAIGELRDEVRQLSERVDRLEH